MDTFHLRTLPGHPWPPLPDAAPSQVWAAYLTLDRTQWLPPEEVERQQLAQARALLAHAVVHVPYYRELLPAAGVYPGAVRTMADFRRLPILPRRTYHDRHPAFTAQELPAGTAPAGAGWTAGTTGRPVPVCPTNVVQLWWCAFYLRNLAWCGFDPTGFLAAIRPTGLAGAELEPFLAGVSQPCWSPPLEGLIEMGPAFGMDIRQAPRLQLQWLDQVAPHYLLSYPTNLAALADLIRARGERLPTLRAVQATGEALPADRRARLEEAFGVPVVETYTCAEAGFLASPCPAGHGLHVHAENVLLEVLDAGGRPCEPGETGRVVITTLQNYRAPLVRYAVGDEATAGAARCPCGRGLPLLRAVHGTAAPRLRLPGGGWQSAGAFVRRLADACRPHPHQLIQWKDGSVLLRLAADEGWAAANADRLREAVLEFFQGPLPVAVEAREWLELPPSGKLQPIVCELEPDGDGQE